MPVGTLGKTEGSEWNDLEPSNGTFVWTRLDSALSEAKSAGITNFIYTLWSTPEWASSAPDQSCILTAIENITGCAAPPTNIGDWDSFVTALVTRYKGEIQYYELWNEANLAETYSGNVSEMVTMAQHAYDDIKSIDPSAIVLTPSSSSLGILPYTPGCNPAECWLAQYLQAGGGKYADGTAFHGYAYLTNDAAGVKVGIACPTGEIEACAGTPLTTEIAGVRSLIANYSLSSKPLIDTEGGLPSDIISKNLTGTADQQTAYLARWFHSAGEREHLDRGLVLGVPSTEGAGRVRHGRGREGDQPGIQPDLPLARGVDLRRSVLALQRSVDVQHHELRGTAGADSLGRHKLQRCAVRPPRSVHRVPGHQWGGTSGAARFFHHTRREADTSRGCLGIVHDRHDRQLDRDDGCEFDRFADRERFIVDRQRHHQQRPYHEL